MCVCVCVLIHVDFLILQFFPLETKIVGYHYCHLIHEITGFWCLMAWA